VSGHVPAAVLPSGLSCSRNAECRGAWGTLAGIYEGLTGLALPEEAPAREWRRLDAVLTYRDGRRQVVEVDERQHFTAARAVTLELYPPDARLGFDAAAWLERSRALTGREPGGGFARARPPLFPGVGGRHRQRAFRDALADLVPPQYGWLPTVRISDTEAVALRDAPDPGAALRILLARRGVPAEVMADGGS
jgi:hypothetical protein